MFCHKCGTQIAEGAAFCYKCGTKVASIEDTPQLLDTKPTTAEPKQPIPTASVQAGVSSDFKEFVDNHVRSTTKFQSAEDLLLHCKPTTTLWTCFGTVLLSFTILGILQGMLWGGVLLGVLFGYTVMFIASAIIRGLCKDKFRGGFIGSINMVELIDFLNESLKNIHPYFHEWGYLTGKGFLPALENAVANSAREVRICSEFGPNRKNLIALYIQPKVVDAKPGEMVYFIDAMKNGFLIDVRAAGFLGHSSLIRTAPILQAAMEYYLKIDRVKE